MLAVTGITNWRKSENTMGILSQKGEYCVADLVYYYILCSCLRVLVVI